ncbi:MAG: LTA synthase family protein, partial [Chitinophagaceae bacterium]|nr:LTA synthase family protein [Chitinophagaceae bacterium]
MSNNKKRISANYYLVFLYRLAVVMLLFFVCRIIFFLLNKNIFPGLTPERWKLILKGGWVFDTAGMLYFNIPFIFLSLLPLAFAFRISTGYQKLVKIIFIVTNFLAVFLNCVDFIYFRFTQRRTGISVLKEFSHEQNKATLGFQFLISYWYVVLIFIALVWLMIWLYNRVKIKPAFIRTKWLYYTKALVIFLLSGALTVGGIRGDFKYSTRPITISNAGEYVKNPQEMYLVLNTP